MNNFLSIKDVSKEIDNFSLGPINLTIEPGTVTALVGDNGSGKSTLLKMIMNLVNADSGTIEAFGQFIHEQKEDWKKFIAYQPQTVIGFDAFSGNDLRELISRWYPNWDQKLFIQMVEELKIPLDKKFINLSQGVQQKLTLALTLPRNTKLLILDEPTSFMDIPSKNLIIDILTEWMEEEDRSIILASHQAEDIKKLADYIVVLRSGKQLDTVEKDVLVERYRKYWFPNKLQGSPIPGEISRSGNEIISNDAILTEKYFIEHHMQPINNSALELEEIITLLLS
ncbi:ABC transporter ATP-binding protein [Pseudogracilibacillus sp. SE30717A]|uniref:ABC transporter ATP-binding protein n=1 Tax=Pseudogracilibacillus sp. SE30717A TaxID=3098293 RepID=UPI00300DD3DA